MHQTWVVPKLRPGTASEYGLYQNWLEDFSVPRFTKGGCSWSGVPKWSVPERRVYGSQEMIEKSYENPVYQSGWYNPLLLDRWVPRCTRESILYQRDECLKCSRVDCTRMDCTRVDGTIHPVPERWVSPGGPVSRAALTLTPWPQALCSTLYPQALCSTLYTMCNV